MSQVSFLIPIFGLYFSWLYLNENFTFNMFYNFGINNFRFIYSSKGISKILIFSIKLSNNNINPSNPLLAKTDENSSLCVLAKLNPSTTKSLINNLSPTKNTLNQFGFPASLLLKLF